MKHTIVKSAASILIVKNERGEKEYWADEGTEIDVEPGDCIQYKDEEGYIVLTVDIKADEAAVFDKALTEAEIEALATPATAPVPVPEPRPKNPS